MKRGNGRPGRAWHGPDSCVEARVPRSPAGGSTRAPNAQGAPEEAPCVVADGAKAGARYTRRRYSPVRVSISMRSPVVTNSGTCTSKPLASFAGFITLPDVSPLTAGSV